jgi:isopenicillin N synthase-like dioxygenase
MAPAPNFPVVSFEPFLHGSEGQQRSVAQELYDAFSVYGWIYLKDFGISQEEVDELFATVNSPSSSCLEISLMIQSEQKVF